jgi:hypothetical protein
LESIQVAKIQSLISKRRAETESGEVIRHTLSPPITETPLHKFSAEASVRKVQAEKRRISESLPGNNHMPANPPPIQAWRPVRMR